MNSQKSSIPILIALLVGCQPVATPTRPAVTRAEFAGKVVKVIDGDTIDVLRDSLVTTRVRLNGIDAPERKQPFSAKAKEHLGGLIGDQPVRVVDLGPDQYGRTIGDVYSGDKMLTLQLVRDGFAWHFKRYSSDPQLGSAEIEARAAKRGLWADPDPVAPWEWRRMEADKKKQTEPTSKQ